MKSLQLTEKWDLALTSGGNLAVLNDADAMSARVAQDVACAERLFQGEAYFRRQDGVPYFMDELGRMPPEHRIRARAEAAALAVPGVKSAEVELTTINARDERTGLPTRTTRGHIHITTTRSDRLTVKMNP